MATANAANLNPDQQRGATSEATMRTREALLVAGLNLFGQSGFDGASTRDIAAKAGVNLAGIAYHFGGKAGLHTACAQLIIKTVGGVLATRLPAASKMQDLTAQQAEDHLVSALEAMVSFLVGNPHSEAIARFVVREQMYPSPAFDILYENLFGPLHKQCCSLWAIATSQGDVGDDSMLAVFALIGQVVFFRLGRYSVFRRMGWSEDSDMNVIVSQISNVLKINVRTLIRERRNSNA